MYRIAYLTSKDPSDKDASSGVYYYQSATLKKYFKEVVFIGPVNSRLINLTRKGFNFFQRFLHKKYNHSHSFIISWLYGKIFTKKLRADNFDFIFADKSSCELAFLKTNIPVIYSTDATFALLNNYHPNYRNLFEFSQKESNIIEQKAINLSSLIICTSEWAAKSVSEHYNFPREKVHVLPRGANIDTIPARELILGKRKTDVCRLIFIGKNYIAKGFDIAYKTMDYIRSRGIPVRLVVVGCTPPQQYIDRDVEIISYIDKNSEKELKKFNSLMLNSDFQLLPTRAECMGISFCESSSYGLPVITTDTGGVTEVVKDGINGYAMDYNADPGEYGEKIISIFKSDENYYSLVKSSRDYFDMRLNWDIWGKKMKVIADEFMLGKEASNPGDLRKTAGN